MSQERLTTLTLWQRGCSGPWLSAVVVETLVQTENGPVLTIDPYDPRNRVFRRLIAPKMRALFSLPYSAVPEGEDSSEDVHEDAWASLITTSESDDRAPPHQEQLVLTCPSNAPPRPMAKDAVVGRAVELTV